MSESLSVTNVDLEEHLRTSCSDFLLLTALVPQHESLHLTVYLFLF